jgi:hypothetical protein
MIAPEGGVGKGFASKGLASKSLASKSLASERLASEGLRAPRARQIPCPADCLAIYWRDEFEGQNHGFVNRIIMQPHFGPARAKLVCETIIVASGPGLDRIPDSSAPQPPGVQSDRARVTRTVQFPVSFGRRCAGLFLLLAARGKAEGR